MITDQILKGQQLFAAFTVDEIHKLSTFTHEKKFKSSETIFEFNKPCSHFYMLIEGQVYLQLPAKPKEFSFAISKIGVGELFGLSPLLKGKRFTASAKCYDNSKVLLIEAKPFLKLLDDNPIIGMDITNQLARIYYVRYLNLLKKLQNIVSQVSIAG